MSRENTLIYISSKGKNSRTGRLSPAQLRFFKPMTQRERGRWLNKLYDIDNTSYSIIYDEEFTAPSIQPIRSGTTVDIEVIIHESLKELAYA